MDVKRAVADNISVPKHVLCDLRRQRLGRIILNMTVFCAVLDLLALLSTVITPILYLLLVVINLLAIISLVFFTLGMVFLIHDGPVQKLWDYLKMLTDSSDGIMDTVRLTFNSTKWISLVGIVLAVASILFIITGKGRYKALKIAALVVLILVFGVILLFQLITGGMQ